MKNIFLNSNLDLVDKIASMPWYYLILGSLIIIPIIIGSWIIVLNQLGAGNDKKLKKIFGIIFLSIYIIGLIILKIGNAKEVRFKEASGEITGELNTRGWTVIGFQRLRENLDNPEYTNEFLKKLIKKSSGRFHKTELLDDGSHDTIGIAIDTVQQKIIGR